MISLKFDNKAFIKEMNNIMEYSAGFVDGVKSGKTEFLNNIGPDIAEIASNFIDVNANVSPQTLHHVYEWAKVGSPGARLFDISYSVSGNGLSFKNNFKQSQTVSNGSSTPFYEKARIMEDGIAIIIKPKKAQALVFDIGGEKVFTRGTVVVDHPGGNVQGEFENVFDLFFSRYFTQSFLKSSGLHNYFSNPVVYKANLRKGKSSGRSAGINTGYNWVIGARVGKS